MTGWSVSPPQLFTKSTYTWTRKMRTWVTTTLPLAIIDIDGVILDNAHRLPHIVHTVDGKQTFKGADANWAAFHGAAHLDTPGAFVPVLKQIIQAKAFHPVFLTARVERTSEVRNALHDHLERVLGYNPQVHDVIMRRVDPEWDKDASDDAQGRKETHAEFKVRVVKFMQAEGCTIGLMVDDSHQNCWAAKELNIPVLRLYNHIDETSLHY